MTDTPSHWKLRCERVEDLAIIKDMANGPTVAFTDLALPPMARAYAAHLRSEQFSRAAYTERGGGFGGFVVDGWHHDPAQSISATSELQDRLSRLMPAEAGRDELTSALANRFSRLASAWDRRKIDFSFRGAGHSADDSLHPDNSSEYVAIGYICNISTLFANPATYKNVSPIAEETMDGLNPRYYYPMNEVIKAGLESVPNESLATWRGALNMKPAPHITPRSTGMRALLMAYTTPQTNHAALR